jgi:HEAT repeat protein
MKTVNYAATVILVLAISGCGWRPPLPIAPPAVREARSEIDAEAVLRAEQVRNLASRKRDGLPELVSALDDPSPLVRVAALETLARLGPDALPAFDAVFRFLDSEPEREAAIRCLAACGADGVPRLAAALAHDKPSVRSGVLEALGRLGRSAEPALDGVIRCADDAEPEVRQAAVLALGSLGVRKAEVEAALRRRLDDAEANVRFFAADSLARLESADNLAVQGLVEGLNSPDASRRVAAALTLVRLGPSGKAAVPTLQRLLESDPEAQVRAAAARALGRIEHAAAVSSLVAALRDPELEVRNAACDALGDIGPEAREALPALRECLKPINGRDAAYRAIRRIEGDADAAPDRQVLRSP